LTGDVFYRLIRRLFRMVAAPMFRFRVEGVDHVPRRGPAILIAQHRSWLDPPCVGGACPRKVHFLIARPVYHTPWVNWFYRWMQSIPVSPDGSGSLVALRKALRRLHDGEVIGIFPEGRVVLPGESSVVQPGAALLAVHTGAPVVPIRIEGSARAWPHGRKWPRPAPVRVSICPPIAPPKGERRQAVGVMAARIEALLELGHTPKVTSDAVPTSGDG
jgi:1-acyl-sn-glycerol-3-phosphate acyltransferase